MKRCCLGAIIVSIPKRPAVYASGAFDKVIKNATIIDGTGRAPRRGDVGITGDTITAIGDISGEQGKTVIQASGLHLCPGFIDIHTHSDGRILACPTADSRVFQGVTTEVTGNCGSSVVPLKRADIKNDLGEFRELGIRPDWTDVASYFSKLEQIRISVNHALLLGQGRLRKNAIGLVDRKLTADELKNVLRAVEEGMDCGAFGVSTGLEYAPGIYTPAEEIASMVRLVARRDGLYATHLRNEGSGLLEAINEAVNVGRETGVRVQISHLKAAGRSNWNKQTAALGLLEKARRLGIDVSADAYPYTAYSTSLSILLKAWVREGGTKAILRRLRNRDARRRIRREVSERVGESPGDFDLIVINSTKSERNRTTIGKNLFEIGEMWKVEPVDALLRLLEEEATLVDFVGHGMAPGNVEMVLSHPLVMIGSDGSSMSGQGKAAEARPHPRSYGTFPRVLGHYVRERRLLGLSSAVKKMTSMPAKQLGLADRGRVARGMKADLVIFDGAEVRDTATFEQPHQYPQGIKHVLVNGILVVENGKHTGARPGMILRKT
ncbi:MAG: amidohydrolase family protein [Phycisphaerae bacterium]|nr:D-aminoacylase [Phycisphaerae bacterium]NIP55232.1 D-aminoacylase [Phycisphaerae bacterium]NIS53889.1 D-aminoacylase [Phycisphaerae bacterium]NIU11501.1 D-aminoacylase [Phycisphaerae bacterium]NIU59284.1 amidohydrolase family protein [Phycisphaerae bacterium]